MKYLTIDEQKELLRTVREVKGADRDAVMIELFLNTGLRVSELVGLLVADVRNKERLWVRPETAKRGKGRFVPLHVGSQDLMHRWIRAKLDPLHESIEDAAPLFVSRSGQGMTKRAVQDIVEKWVRRAGLVDGTGGPLYSVHSLRHTFAIRFLERNGQSAKALRALQKILGHSSLASTGVYTEATDTEMAETMHLMSLSQTRANKLMKAGNNG